MKSDKKENRNCSRESLLLYAVTDRAWTGKLTLLEQVEQALEGGVTFLQLREKNLCEEEFLKEAKALKTLCLSYGVPFVINDNVDIAIAVDADGVHVGQDDMEAGSVREKIGPEKILGVSVQTVEQALLAEARGADYLGVGAVFPTGTKTDAVDVPHEQLQQICQAVKIPVVAIGGISEDNVDRLTGRKLAGIAVVSAIFGKEDILSATRELKRRTERMVRDE